MRHLRDFVMAMGITTILAVLFYTVFEETLRPLPVTEHIWPIQLVYIAR